MVDGIARGAGDRTGTVIQGGVKPVPGVHREQMNKVTSLLDGSTIYGVTVAENALLREGSGGRMLLNHSPSSCSASIIAMRASWRPEPCAARPTRLFLNLRASG
jgi:hypothetical protein